MQTPLPGHDVTRRQVLISAGAAAVCVGCSVATEDIAELTGDIDRNSDTDSTAANSTSFGFGFGQRINLGPVADVIARIRENDGFWYRPDARMWLTEYPADALPQARDLYSESELIGMEAGLVALFQKCPHLGCRVPNCETSQWFECPCHGSKYNRVGEKQGGPAPRGMDRFGVEITSQGDVIVDTAHIIQGPPIGTNTTGQQPAGPFCIGEASH